MKFKTADVLSVVTGKLLTEGDIKGIASLIEFMCGQPVPLIFRDASAWECREALFTQLPDLKQVDAAEIGSENWREFISQQEAILGTDLEVSPLSNEMQEVLAAMIQELPDEAKLISIKDGGYNR